MKIALTLIVTASITTLGCKKKEEGAPGAPPAGSAAPAPSGKEAPAPTGATALKSCEELGGTAEGKTCVLKGPAPFEATFTGKFEGTSMRPAPGAVFKVTSKFDRPVNISNAQLYAYDKTGNQIDIVHENDKMKYAQDSSSSLIELAPGETKEFVHSTGKENLPDMDTVQLEFFTWSATDGSAEFVRRIGDDEARPKDGWK